MRIKAAKLFIPYLSKDLSSPAGERMETGNPAALLSLHYQLFTEVAVSSLSLPPFLFRCPHLQMTGEGAGSRCPTQNWRWRPMEQPACRAAGLWSRENWSWGKGPDRLLHRWWSRGSSVHPHPAPHVPNPRLQGWPLKMRGLVGFFFPQTSTFF